MAEFFIRVMGQESGPYSSKQVREMAANGLIQQDYLIRRDTGEWKLAGGVKGLEFGVRAPAPPPKIPPKPKPQPVPVQAVVSQGNTQRIVLLFFGMALLMVGLLVVAVAFFADTTVSAGFNRRVHNIGLQQQQMMMLIVGIAMSAAGATALVVEHVTRKPAASEQTSITSAVEYNQQQILRIAKEQRYLTFVVFAIIAANVLSFVSLSYAPALYGFIVSVTFVIAIVCVIFSFRFFISVYGASTGIILGVFSFIPLFNLILLLVGNSKATSILQRAGLEVSLMGVSADSLRMLERSAG